ncbi:VOC family protein [Flavobacterium sp. J372]|uniref:VOC family protein n=1 Tax=Flavobacterium sp. J372 TaxID=2898436 RepID=UPI002150B47D|nr:VOC family protein [Flavobacterium sp. J372]MCR5861250.1 VOC family protein [Flavobacterium sp. J372]
MKSPLTLRKIETCLWFDRNAEEAANFYLSVFKNGRIGRKMYYGKEGFEIHGMPEGTLLTIEIEVLEHKFVLLNGGPIFKPNEAISFIINCNDQEEIDYYWEKIALTGDPKAQQCGWCKDKYGVSWQVVPPILDDMISNPDKEKAGRVMNALHNMVKIDIAVLEEAFEGR